MSSPHTTLAARSRRAALLALCACAAAQLASASVFAETAHMTREALPLVRGAKLQYRVNPWGKSRVNRSIHAAFTIAEVERGDDALPSAVTVDVETALASAARAHSGGLQPAFASGHGAMIQPPVRARAEGLGDAPMMRLFVQVTLNQHADTPEVGSLLWLGRAQCVTARYRGEVTLDIGAPIEGQPARGVRLVWVERAEHTLALDGREARVPAMVLASEQGDRLVVLDDCTTPLVLEAELRELTAELEAVSLPSER